MNVYHVMTQWSQIMKTQYNKKKVKIMQNNPNLNYKSHSIQYTVKLVYYKLSELVVVY